ncbi:MAG: MFS transporter [Candidatus Pacebacteria bacterium]|jgi:MFS family permease|nr:MFS transporter [Candidatus Paceibacterota bacterium]
MENTPRKEKSILGFKKNIFYLGLVSFFNDFSSEMVQSVMPIFITSVLGAPVFAVGLIEGVADALASVLKLFSGWFSDKLGKRKAPAIWGYSLSVATRAFLASAGTFGQVFGLRIIDRVGKGLRSAPRDALIVDSVEKSELSKSFGFHRAMDTLGATLGPLLAFALIPLSHDGYRRIFWIAFVLGIFAVLSFVCVKEKKKDALTPAAKPKLNWALFREHTAFVSIVGSIFIFGLGTLPIGLVLLRSQELAGASIANVPFMYFVYSLTFVLVAVPIGKLADRLGERRVIASGFLLAVLAYVFLVKAQSLPALILCFVLLGLYSAATDGIQRALAGKLMSKELVATGQGFLNMAIGFSSLGAGLIGGTLWTVYGSHAAFWYAALASVVGLVLFWYVTHERKPAILEV